jgi:hypothetical protein
LRPLSDLEVKRLGVLTNAGLRVGLLQPTGTALEKSIIDAIEPFRDLLVVTGVHNFATQAQGQAYKVRYPARLLVGDNWVECTASLYRPETKLGDPRVWFAGIKELVGANNILAVVPALGHLNLINLTRDALELRLDSEALAELLETGPTIDAVAQELLRKLKAIALRGPVPAIGHGDTTIGMTLENLLGLPPNSSKKPDYKGIELKVSRKKPGKKQQNRVTLFAQVAEWGLSGCKSSAAILDLFGYPVDGVFKLSCQVCASTFNSQGLRIKVDDNAGLMIETSKIRDNVAVWRLEKLRQRLREKHSATFWVAGQSSIVDGKEHFTFSSVEYTRDPLTENFGALLNSDVVTLDHLIRRYEDGSVTEKGPLFRIHPRDLGLLFPSPQSFSLTT